MEAVCVSLSVVLNSGKMIMEEPLNAVLVFPIAWIAVTTQLVTRAVMESS